MPAPAGTTGHRAGPVRGRWRRGLRALELTGLNCLTGLELAAIPRPESGALREYQQYIGGEWISTDRLFDGPASMTDFTELQWITTREGSGSLPT